MRKKFVSWFLIQIVLMTLFLALSTTSSFAASVQNASGKINSSDGAYLRESASTSSKKIKLLADNTDLTIKCEIFTSKTSTNPTSVWYSVVANGKSGYVRSDLVDNVNYSAVSAKVTSKVNYRVGPGTKMTIKGYYKAGTAVTVYCKARPVDSTKGSSTFWYKIKVGSSYRYVASAYINIVGSIFVNNVTKEESETVNSNTNNNSRSSGNTSSDSDFEAALSSQGFPESYKTKLRELHKAHPNWVFVAKNTGISWDTAVSKESANGVSLVEASQPLSYRATDSNSFKSGTRTIYKSASTSGGSLGTILNMTEFTLITEKWSGTTQWSYIKTSNGTTGYVKGDLYTQSYPSYIEGTVNDYLNLRRGASTSASVIKTLDTGTKIKIVLQCTDSSGNKWYKIAYDNSYGYVSADYVNLSGTCITEEQKTTTSLSSKYPKGKLTADSQYRAMPNESYPVLGTFANGTELTIVSYVKDSSGKVWYKAVKDGKLVYIKNSNITVKEDVYSTSCPSKISGETNTDVNYRTGAGTNYSRVGCLNGGVSVTVCGVAMSGSTPWYKVEISGKTYYMCAEYINLNCETAPSDSAPSVSTQTVTSQKSAKPDSLTGKATIMEGSWIAKDGSTWFNANKSTVAYYMDPRNFLNEDRIYMFENLSYQSAYQTTAVVSKVLSGSKLPSCGFTAQMFVNAGANNNISPVFLAARARQETGGGSIAISGYSYNGTVVYNPFNIGASSGSNPVMKGIAYAYSEGWTSQTKAVNGAAAFLSSGYINAGQNSIYYQRFNVANGTSRLATHQYMTNLLAPYYEAYTTKTTYASYGITNEALSFIIPIYDGMPSSTKLP